MPDTVIPQPSADKILHRKWPTRGRTRTPAIPGSSRLADTLSTTSAVPATFPRALQPLSTIASRRALRRPSMPVRPLRHALASGSPWVPQASRTRVERPGEICRAPSAADRGDSRRSTLRPRPAPTSGEPENLARAARRHLGLRRATSQQGDAARRHLLLSAPRFRCSSKRSAPTARRGESREMPVARAGVREICCARARPMPRARPARRLLRELPREMQPGRAADEM